MALQSYAHGSGDTPLLGVTVGQLLDTAARRWPDNDALIVVDQGIRWNWRELRERAKSFAAGLLALGLEPGEVLIDFPAKPAMFQLDLLVERRDGTVQRLDMEGLEGLLDLPRVAHELYSTARVLRVFTFELIQIR